MKAHTWALLDRICASLNGPGDVPPGLMPGMATRLEEAIVSPSPDHIKTLAQQLTGLVQALLRTSPPEIGRAAQGEGDAHFRAAYTLGQVSFAQRLASQVTEKRADRRFLAAMTKPRYRAYVVALSRRDMTGRELADACKETQETVSRKLKVLRGLGIADFRREGTSFVNFLTPAARAACPSLAEASPQVDADLIAAPRRSELFRCLAQSRIKTLPPHLQHSKTFSRDIPPAQHKSKHFAVVGAYP